MYLAPLRIKIQPVWTGQPADTPTRVIRGILLSLGELNILGL
jgi:hypothetical protein